MYSNIGGVIEGSYKICETLSDEKNSGKTGNLSSGQESRDKKSSSTHSRIFNQSSKQSQSIYGDNTIENLRNIYKAEKELRGIFQ